MNVFDYLTWRGDLSFNESHFNDIDAGIFSDISYVPLDSFVPSYPSKESIKLKDCADLLFSTHSKEEMNMGLILPNEILDLFEACQKSFRFGNCKLSNYVNIISEEQQEQFSAFTAILNKDTLVVTYRGTDDTFVGWLENVNMLFKYPVPAQKDAADYLNTICEMYPNKKIYVTGHSKGGNLAIYASIYCDDKYKNRIIKIINNDGPGFKQELLDKNKYRLVKKKIITILPQDSIIGMIFDTVSKTRVVKSNAKGLYQHNYLSWQLDGPKYVTLKTVSEKSVNIDSRIKVMIANISESDAKDLANNIFLFYSNAKFSKLNDIKKSRQALLSSMRTINKNTRKLLMALILLLIKNNCL